MQGLNGPAFYRQGTKGEKNNVNYREIYRNCRMAKTKKITNTPKTQGYKKERSFPIGQSVP
jgi:hypothetical protein